MFEQKITFDRFMRWAIVGGIVVAVLGIINYLSAVLLPFFIAWLLAYLMYPLVKFFENRLKIRVRAVSILLSMFVVVLALAGITWMIIPPLIEQFGKFGQLAMHHFHNITHLQSIPEAVTNWATDNRHEIERFLRSDDFTDAVKEAMPRVFNFLGRTWNVFVGIVGSCMVLLYMFFILLDYEFLTDNWVKIFPKSVRPFWKDLGSDAAIALNSYVRGQCLVALTMGVLFCIGFSIIGLPMAIGLGILIGILDLVPYLHTFALIPAALLAGLKALDTGQNFWVVFALVLLVFGVVQVIIDMVVTPKIMGKQMGLNPAILLLALSVWGALLGFIGLIIALPLTTIIMAYWQRYVSEK